MTAYQEVAKLYRVRLAAQHSDKPLQDRLRVEAVLASLRSKIVGR